ncbi:MAG: DNA-protecting protein DprA [Candidatus Niyogibacteria bacterium CG10_big_fil_rev_8_21_14_0_10_42_19]|uniref:DNA-protecting protein DprA n=1 Tax=Candidatus Niyogibacteria bacterium CG10_big_fil_rev_8_21_14_0_10_42_19 TaxID=1974725 RepID=A0A2H0TGD8_9BACT|nr:MAG: DNA-protecting protein DprA [Candidatus Niyogibacteria bacterium CG10_big_fil_rev_8_21_14_0_10_42_19]
MNMSNEHMYGHALNLIPNTSTLKLEKLLNSLGSFENSWFAEENDLVGILSDNDYVKNVIEHRKNIKPEAELIKLENAGISLLSLNDPEYPALLREIPHPPPIFYFKGVIEKNKTPKVAIVGTRRASHYGMQTAFDLAAELSSAEVCVVSGLALGIDSAAHRGAIAGKTPTFAVLGSGLEKIYPSSNKGLAEKIIENRGAVISEFPPAFDAQKWTFPQRNRIIAGLAQATIVIEAPERSGSLITAGFALDANREVGAVPGEITSINSTGTNALLRKGAAVIRCAQDALELIKGVGYEQEAENLNETENLILSFLRDEPHDAEDLIKKSNCSASELTQKLTFLELKGAIKNKSGTFYIT